MKSPKRFALLFVLAAAVLFAPADSSAQNRRNKKQQQIDYGRIEITTNPAGYPVLVDGRPTGETTTTVRNLDLEPGRHRVEIQFPNNTRWVRDFEVLAGRRECINLNFRPRTISIERPGISPCPYTVTVSAPATVNDGDLITFTSDVAYNGPGALNYMWTVSPAGARITQGAGTQTITVDSTGLGRTRITAVLMVDDGSGDRNCRQSATASTSVVPVAVVRAQPRKFDEFPETAFDDTKARLDNLAVELQNDPTASGYVIVYGSQSVRRNTATRLGDRARGYLTTTRGIDPSRITVVDGGTRPGRGYYELYVVPQGAEPPRATSR